MEAAEVNIIKCCFGKMKLLTYCCKKTSDGRRGSSKGRRASKPRYGCILSNKYNKGKIKNNNYILFANYDLN